MDTQRSVNQTLRGQLDTQRSVSRTLGVQSVRWTLRGQSAEHSEVSQSDSQSSGVVINPTRERTSLRMAPFCNPRASSNIETP